MTELLLELFSEEIPARMQSQSAEQLQTLVTDRLKAADLGFNKVSSYVTPRRLALIIEGLPLKQENKNIEIKGPRVDAPEQALEGFLRSNNLRKDQLEVRSTPKGDFYFSVVKQNGKTTSEIIQPLLEEAIDALRWPKSMKWGAYPIRWVRPLSSILCLFDGEIIPVGFGHIIASNRTRGHRFLSGEAFTVANSNDYKKQLAKHHVVLDQATRKQQILEGAEKLAASKKLSLKEDAGLLEEITGLVEYPVPLMGRIDESFMRVPQEVLISSMRTHQKYFSLLDNKGKLAPYFITVSNIKTKDNETKILAGNERVLRARLSDAAFFWDQDRKLPLYNRVKDLRKVVFHARLGSVGDKVKRMTELAKLLSVWIPHANLLMVERAAQLAKADLSTGMVGEFPELQGIMGGYYAEYDNEEPEVVAAIGDHYRPQGPNDSVPTAPVSIAVALADKIDTLVGLFAIDEKPTGSKDPFALRRAALGVVRIIMENNLRIPLKLLFEKALNQYPKSIFKEQDDASLTAKLLKRAMKSTEGDSPQHKKEQVIEELLTFFEDRLKASLKSENIRHDLIDAVFDGGNEDDLFRLVDRVHCLNKFVNSPDGGNLLAAYKRAANILRIEEKKDDLTYAPIPTKEYLTQKEEKDLFRKIKEVRDPIEKAIKSDNFEEAMTHLSTLREEVDAFFDKVTVNTDNAEVRSNRLKMLSNIRHLMDGVANFGKIEG
jgi:glycyl-tRNA synthetase beta chain